MEKIEKRRVLVVEDDTHLLSGIRDILELEDYSVQTAKNGQEGLQLLKGDVDNPPDVIVSDIMMPYMDGFQFLEKVREETRWVNVPFIFLTAKSERDDKHRGSLMGADVYLTKPFDADDLVVAVEAVIKRTDAIVSANDAKVAQQRDKLMTILNHEMRTPLTLVVAYSEMLKEFNSDSIPAEEMSFLQGVHSGADRLRRLVENFITVVELDMGEANKTVEWRKRPIEDWTLIVEDAYRQVNLPERPRNFKIQIEDNLRTINADGQYMTIAIRELLENAAKFSSANDMILLRISNAENGIVIQVKDEGRGIPDHVVDRIWEPFFQHNREQFEDQGSGSGLAIVRGIVRLHDGDYKVDTIVDEGSTFSIYLPIG